MNLGYYSNEFYFIYFNVQTRHHVQWLYQKLGFEAAEMHCGTSSFEQRRTAVNNFTSGRSTILITTDVLSIGIDFIKCKICINMSLPTNGSGKLQSKIIANRINRCGRQMSKGVSFYLVDKNDYVQKKAIKSLEKNGCQLQFYEV